MRQPDATDVAEIDQPAVGADEVWFEAMGRSAGHCRTHARRIGGWVGQAAYLADCRSVHRSE